MRAIMATCYVCLVSVLIFLIGGQSLNVRANDTPTKITTTVYVVDTKGNQLKAPAQFTITATNSTVDCVNVRVPGYEPVETVRSIKFGVDPAFQAILNASSKAMTLDTPNNRVIATLQPVNPNDSLQITYIGMAEFQVLVDNKLMKPFNTISEAFINFLEAIKTGISFEGTPPLSMQFYGQMAPSSITVTYEYQPASATVNYVNDDAKGAIVKSDLIDGFVAKNGEYTPVAPNGYQLVDPKPIKYTLTSDDTDNLTVHVKPESTTASVTPSTPTGEITTPKHDSSSAATTPAASESTTQQANTASTPNNVAVKGAAVYATKGIYLYQNSTFKNTQRLAKYPKAKRISRPMFVVTGYAHSANGTLRYKVRDVNHGSKTAGKVGYITANQKYVVPVYYKTMPKSRQITVINPKGVNAYKRVNLTGKIVNYKKGTPLVVKKIVKHRLTTRYQLSNGTYITGNKKLVIQVNH